MGNPYGDLPHSEPTRLTDSAEEYAAPSEAAMKAADEWIYDTFSLHEIKAWHQSSLARALDTFAQQAVAAAVAERGAAMISALQQQQITHFDPAALTERMKLYNGGLKDAIGIIQKM